MYVIDLNGDQHALMATQNIDHELNGNQTMTCTIESNQVNDIFIEDISEMWTIADHDNVEYKITYVTRQSSGDKIVVKVKATLLFMDKMNTDIVYESYSESLTALEYFNIVFNDTDFNFVLLGTFYASSWSNLGRTDTRLKLFKDGINRYGADFYIEGNTVYLDNEIGRDVQFMYHHRLNASNIVQEIDASNLFTYARGYGNYADGEEDNYQLFREYPSPLESILGRRHAKPIYDGRIKDGTLLENKLKKLVDDSLKVSISGDIHEMRKQGYDESSVKVGDRTFIVDDVIGYKAESRVVNTTTSRDWTGKILDQKINWGAGSLTKRYQSNLKTAMQSINDLVAGRTKLPYSVLDEAVQIATKALQSITTELSVPPNGGLMAVDKNDPNIVVLFNAAGIGISRDGGTTFETAMTGNGIVADVITAGVLRGITIIQESGGDKVQIDSGVISTYFYDTIVTKLDSEGLTFYDNDGVEVGTVRDAVFVNDNSKKGVSFNTAQDFVHLGFGPAGGTGDPVFSSLKKGSDAGYTRIDSVPQGGTADGKVPHVIFRNYTENNIALSDAVVYCGRDNRTPGANDEIFGFKVRQYRGTGDGDYDTLFTADTRPDGKTFTDINTDVGYLPPKTWMGTKSGTYYTGLGVTTSNRIESAHGVLNENGIVYFDVIDLNFTTGTHYSDYTFNGAENLFSVFVQVEGAHSSNIVAGVENISSTGFRVYIRNVTGNTTADNRTYKAQLFMLFEPS